MQNKSHTSNSFDGDGAPHFGRRNINFSYNFNK